MTKHTQLSLAVNLPDDETFVSFLSGENLYLVPAIHSFIDDPSDTKHSNTITSLVLFGAQGVGKSHLLHASCAYAESKNISSVCLSLTEYSHLPVNILDGLETIELVCLDDVHLVKSQLDWQQGIFDLYNRISERGGKLLITANDAITNIDFKLPDLKSRLQWGLTEQVKALSDEDKVVALQLRAKTRGIDLSNDVAKFLFTRLSRDMKDIIDSLNRLDEASIREQRKITIPFIKDILSL